MANSIIILGFLAIFGIAEINCQYGPLEDCSKTGILRCYDDFQSFYGPGVFERIQADFKGFCSTIANTISCVERKMKTCIKDEKQQTDIRNATQLDAVEQMQKTICSEEFKATYEDLNKETCYGPVESEILKCKDNLERNVAVTTQGTTELMYKICCAQDEYRKCSARTLENKCSKKVAQAVNSLLSTLYNKPQCELYKSGTELCDPYLPYMSSKGNFGQPLLWIIHCVALAVTFSFS